MKLQTTVTELKEVEIEIPCFRKSIYGDIYFIESEGKCTRVTYYEGINTMSVQTSPVSVFSADLIHAQPCTEQEFTEALQHAMKFIMSNKAA